MYLYLTILIVVYQNTMGKNFLHNSYAEYFLQIASLFKSDYENACEKIAIERTRFINELNKIDKLKVYFSQANYVMCGLKEYDSTELAIELLENYNIFIKDLKGKTGFKDKNYIRLAIRTEEENKKLEEALKSILI